MSEAASLFKTSRVLLLGIDTSADGDLSLAELREDGMLTLLAQQSLDPRRQSVELISKLSSLFDDADVSGGLDSSYLQDRVGLLSGIIVVSGPGTFTGLRIGLSAAKGLAHATGVPLIAISAFHVLSFGHKDRAAVMYAGRDTFFVGLPDGRESLESDASLQACIAGRPVATAQGEVASRLSQGNSVLLVRAGAFAAIRAATSRFLLRDFENLSTLDANYVRKPYTDKAVGMSLHD